MPFEKLNADVSVIMKLPNVPGSTGMTPEELKAAFDRPSETIKGYINEVLYPEIQKKMDGNSSSEDTLDPSLIDPSKPAQAKAVGDAVWGLFTNAVHEGDYVLGMGSFAATQNGIRTIHIGGGKAVISGHYVEISAADVELSPGTSGMKRNDIVALRFQRGNDGVVSSAVTVIKGSDASSEPEDPATSNGDINSGLATARDLPLYRASVNGTTLESVTAMFHPETPVSFLQFRDVAVAASAFQDYTEREDVGIQCRAAVPLTGVDSTMYPEITFSIGDALGGTVTSVAETYDGGIYVFSTCRPETDMVIPLITVRKEV